jgi:hypothetical protein
MTMRMVEGAELKPLQDTPFRAEMQAEGLQNRTADETADWP